MFCEFTLSEDRQIFLFYNNNDNNNNYYYYYRIVLIFRGSLILRISRIWNRSRNYFSENFDTSKLSHIGDVKAAHSRNYFNEIKKKKLFADLRKRYTVYLLYNTIYNIIPRLYSIYGSTHTLAQARVYIIIEQ